MLKLYGSPKLVIALVLLVLIIILCAIFLPVYVYMPPERLAAEQMYNIAAKAKHTINHSIIKAETVIGSGKGVTLPSFKGSKYGDSAWVISQNGQITGSNGKYVLRMMLTPRWQNKRVIWDCRVFPFEYTPKPCFD